MRSGNSNKVIAICSSEFPPGPGGIGAHAFQLASFLTDRGFSISVYTAAREAHSSNQFDLESSFEIKRYQANRNFLYKLFRSISFLYDIRKRVDWVILSGSSQLILSLFVRVLSKAKTLSVIHGHEVLMARGIERRILHMALKSVNVIVAVSEFSKKILLSSSLDKSIIVFPNGIPYKNKTIVAHRARPRSQDHLILVTVGSITRRKGQHNVVQAIPHLLLVFKRVDYHIIGMPSEKLELDRLAKELKVFEYLHYHGVIDDVEKVRIVSESDIFIMLSENQPNGDVEGFGIAVLEANQLGIPAIGARNTGVEQAIDNGVSGVLVGAKNTREIVQAVVEITNSYKKYVEGSIHWAKKHDWQVIGEKYIQVLNS